MDIGDFGGVSGGSGHPPEGQGGWNRESYQLPHEGMSQAKYANQLDNEAKEAASGKRPGMIERFKRWFSARF
jgi:hypothetical protein